MYLEQNGRPMLERAIYVDALRGVAIMLVIAYHVCTRFGHLVSGYFFDVFSRIGWVGVDIFFAISGFLITRILVSGDGAGRVSIFFTKRFFRIVPLYVVAVCLYVLVSVVTGFERSLLDRIWVSALFLNAWLIPFWGEGGVPYTILWSVSVEEFAYIVFGLFSILGVAWLRRVLLCVVFLSLGVRLLVALNGLFDVKLLYYFAPARIDSIAIGGMLAVSSFPSSWSRVGFIGSSLFLLFVIFVFAIVGRSNYFLAIFGYTILGIASSLVVALLFFKAPSRKGMLVRALARVGEVSYFIYLFHMFVIGGLFYVMTPQLINALGFFPIFLLVVGVTYGLASVSWRCFENPLMAVGRRISVVISSRSRLAGIAE